MKKILLLLSIFALSATAFAYTITHDDGYSFDGYCKAGTFFGFFDEVNSHGQACANGQCVTGNSKYQIISKVCGE